MGNAAVWTTRSPGVTERLTFSFPQGLKEALFLRDPPGRVSLPFGHWLLFAVRGGGAHRQIKTVAMTARVSVSLETGRGFRVPGRRLWGWGERPCSAALETEPEVAVGEWEGLRAPGLRGRGSLRVSQSTLLGSLGAGRHHGPGGPPFPRPQLSQGSQP